MRPKTALVLLVIFCVLLGGYAAYDYVKKTPPSWLIKAVTKTDPPPPLPAGPVAPFPVPEGFIATIYSRDTPGVRVLTRDPNGVLVASLLNSGKIVALPDENNDAEADEVITILENLNKPHGILFDCDEGGSCFLYVGEEGAVKRYSYDPAARTATYDETLLTTPAGSGHFTRTFLMHPDSNTLLVSIGSSCNVCNETNPLRATITAIDLTTGDSEVYATGLRNAVFLALHPVTGEIWATDNARDLLGDNIPPDEVNIIRKGNDYGWPICYGNNVHDTDFDKRQYIQNPCTGKISPHLALQAHSAALGIAFVPEEGWPEDMWHDALIAYHGSWNRSTPTGYSVVRFDLAPNGMPVSTTPIDFMSGFLPEGGDEDSVLGRPVGLLAEPGGVVFVSDDRSGAIYRVAWQGQ